MMLATANLHVSTLVFFMLGGHLLVSAESDTHQGGSVVLCVVQGGATLTCGPTHFTTVIHNMDHIFL